MTRQGNDVPDDQPIVLVTEGPHGPVVHDTNRAARAAGVTSGARVVDMNPICPDLRVEYADVAGDKLALDRLRLWVRRWCPWSVTDAPNGLILDVTGSTHLFGGPAEMLVDIESRLSVQGLSVGVAMAPTWGAAWSLARFGPVRAMSTDETLSAMIAPLPVAALRIDEDTALLLRRLGLKRIGQLADVPRLPLMRRFAKAPLDQNPVMRLDQMMGDLAEPVSSQEAPPPFQVQSRLAEPIQDPTPYLQELCDELCKALARAGSGCRGLQLTIFRTDGEVRKLDVTTSAPTRDSDHLRRLFNDRLEKIDPGFGFDLITLEARGVEPVAEGQRRLDKETEDHLHLSRLVDRLSARFGQKAVTTLEAHESHIPERQDIWRQALSQTKTTPPKWPDALRPERILQRPEEIKVLYEVPEGPPAQFIWRRQTFRVARYDGPERIAPEWWAEKAQTRLRDYFRVEDPSGRRLWVYREGLLGDGRGGAPRWFVHGMFA